MSGIECKQIKLPEGSPSQRGRSAEVYPWGEDKVLKLYFEGFPEADVDLEYLNTAEAYKCGCTPMKCYEKVRCGNRFGIVIGKVKGIPMTKTPEKNPFLLFTAPKTLAEQHIKLQKHHSNNLPDIRDKAAACLDAEQFGFLSPAEKEKIRGYLASLPAGDTFLHMDFHTENILMDGKNAVVIDWMTAAKGQPAAEVAMMQFLLHDAELFPGSSKLQLAFYSAVRNYLYRGFMKHYFKATGMKQEEVDKWKIVALIIRLGLWNIDSEKPYIEGEIKRLTEDIGK